jgi:putative transposase
MNSFFPGYSPTTLGPKKPGLVKFVSRDLDLWAYQRGVRLDFSRSGKPTDTASVKSFNGNFRAECLNAHWFLSVDDAQRRFEDWRGDYKEERPHSALDNFTPDCTDESISGSWPT